MLQSSPGSATSLKIMPSTGTRSARTGVPRTRAAKRPLAATGKKPGACGSSRATTFRPIKKATSSKSIQSFARLLVGCIAVGSCLRCGCQSIARSRPELLSRRNSPFGKDRRQLIEAVRKRGGSRLQNEGRFDLAQPAIRNGRNLLKARSRSDFVRHELLSAPGAHNNVRLCGDHLFSRYNPILGILARGKLRKHFHPAGGFY